MKTLFLVIGLILISVLVGFFVHKSQIKTQTESKMEQPLTAKTVENGIEIIPISHATMILKMGNQVIYNDPVQGMQRDLFAGQPSPTLILVSDIHGDHFNVDTLKAIAQKDTVIVVPQAVKDKMPDGFPGTVVVMHNGEKGIQKGIEIEAIPMYNIPENPEAFHTKGRGNGYVLNFDNKRVYIAGDTSATPEMKALKDIDIAFVPMNLPYTMDEAEAAEGVLAFKPKIVHPYHYRTPKGLSDINKFKALVTAKDPNIQVDLLNFYPEGNK